jgi:hypothetical protein
VRREIWSKSFRARFLVNARSLLSLCYSDGGRRGSIDVVYSKQLARLSPLQFLHLPTFPRLLLSPDCSDVGTRTSGLTMARFSRSRGYKYRKHWRVRQVCRQSTHKGIAVQTPTASPCVYPTLNGEILVLYRVGGSVLGAAAAKVR